MSCYRKDEYDEAVESLMSLGGAMLRVGGSNLLQYVSSPSSIAGPVGVNKIGVAATEEDTTLSEEEKLHRLQVSRISEENYKISSQLSLRLLR